MDEDKEVKTKYEEEDEEEDLNEGGNKDILKRSRMGTGGGHP